MTEKDFEKNMERISKKLDLVASLLLDLNSLLSENTKLKEKVKYLVDRGVTRDEDIASILGTSKSYASKEKALLKKNG